MLEEAEDTWKRFRSEDLAKLKAKDRDEHDFKRQKLRKKAQKLERDAQELMQKAKDAVLAEADVSLPAHPALMQQLVGKPPPESDLHGRR